ncbi:MAG: ABC transporter ATP-binding protein, partial [Bacillota bacterium]|nr:ABC transporter ATP-binding protein [Bacillota bacterium]
MRETRGGQPRGPGGGPGIRMGMPLGRPVEKAKDFKGTLRRLLGYLRPHIAQLVIVLVMAILSTVFTIAGPKIMGRATTALFRGLMLRLQGVPGASIDFAYIKQILMLLMALYLFSAFFSYVQQIVMAVIAQKTVFNMRRDISEKLSRLPLKFYDSRTHGEILSRVTNDVDTVSNTLQQSITQLITAAVTLVGVIVMMLTISPTLTAVTLVTLPLYVIVTTAIASRSQKYFAAQAKALGDLNGHVEEMYTGHEVVKAFGREHKSLAKFGEINEKLYAAGWKAQFISGVIMPLMNLISNIGYVIVCVVGGIFVTRGTIQIGDVQAFIQYSRQFAQPIVQTATIANVLQSTVASAERVFELLDEPEEVPDTVAALELESPKGAVQIENVSFGYAGNANLFENLNIDVRPGQTIAIVGPTGAGKTTLVNLLMRFYDVAYGRITVDGVDVRDMKRGHLRSIFGMVLQDTWLFNGTIKDNIAYGRANVTDDEIIKASRAAHADHFIRTLPDGYDTILNEDASNISQGQRQLLTIARVILSDPAIL